MFNSWLPMYLVWITRPIVEWLYPINTIFRSFKLVLQYLNSLILELPEHYGMMIPLYLA